VDDADFEVTLDRLRASISEVITLLTEFGEAVWAEWFQKDLRRLGQGDIHGLDHVLSAFGGMGSFSDVYVHPRNGHAIELERVEEINDRLSDLRGAVYRNASDLRRSLR